MTSEPHNRMTDQPSLRRAEVTSRSRRRLRSNLAIQNWVLVAGAAPSSNHLRPCQKSPSIKTASRASGKVKSGLPSIFGSFLRKERQMAANARASRTSGSVSAVRTLRMMRRRVASSKTSAMLLCRLSFHPVPLEPPSSLGGRTVSDLNGSGQESGPLDAQRDSGIAAIPGASHIRCTLVAPRQRVVLALETP